jgi:hypothetical protein
LALFFSPRPSFSWPHFHVPEDGGGKRARPHEPDDGGGKEEDRPHPNLLPQEKEDIVPAPSKLGRPEMAPVQGFEARIF